MNRLFIYRLICLLLVGQACFAVAGTLMVWRETLSANMVPLFVGSQVLLVFVAGFHYVVPKRNALAIVLAGAMALGFFCWVGAVVPAGPSLFAQLARAAVLLLGSAGLQLIGSGAVAEWRSSLYGDELGRREAEREAGAFAGAVVEDAA